jgi:hypothetical protein
MGDRSEIKCFWLEPTPYARVSLRRYKGYGKDGPCPTSGVKYHNASAVVVSMMDRPLEEQYDTGELEYDDYPHDDPRWPKACPCGYVFQDDDSWQVNTQRFFSSPEMNGLLTIDDAPVGAMWDAWWYDTKGPDGKCIVVRTPGGDWIVDYPCKYGRGWTRTGEPPNITARPSIGIGKADSGTVWAYHGFLTDGVLVEC